MAEQQQEIIRGPRPRNDDDIRSRLARLISEGAIEKPEGFTEEEFVSQYAEFLRKQRRKVIRYNREREAQTQEFNQWATSAREELERKRAASDKIAYSDFYNQVFDIVFKKVAKTEATKDIFTIDEEKPWKISVNEKALDKLAKSQYKYYSGFGDYEKFRKIYLSSGIERMLDIYKQYVPELKSQLQENWKKERNKFLKGVKKRATALELAQRKDFANLKNLQKEQEIAFLKQEELDKTALAERNQLRSAQYLNSLKAYRDRLYKPASDLVGVGSEQSNILYGRLRERWL